MQSASSKVISITPEEITFPDVQINVLYSKTINIKNTIGASIELSLKSSSAERLEINPKLKRLNAHESADFEVKVRMIKPFPRKGILHQPLKDYIYVKSNYFDMKIPITILPPSRAGSQDPKAGRATTSPPPVSNRFKKSTEGGDYQNTIKMASQRSTESQMMEQSTKIKQLEDELTKAKAEIERQQMKLTEEEQKSTTSKKLHEIANIQAELAKEAMAGTGSNNAAVATAQTEDILTKIKELLKEKHPSLETLMDVSLKQEREKHERQNEKVLQILKIKDSLIEELQGKALEMNNKYMEAKNDNEENLKISKKAKEEAEETKKELVRITGSVAEKEETIRLLNDELENMKEELKLGQERKQPMTEAADNTEMILLREEFQKKSEELQRQAQEMEKLGRELLERDKKINELQKREEYVIELANRQEDIKSKYDVQIKSLEQAKERMEQEIQIKQKENEKIKQDLIELEKSKGALLGKIESLEKRCTEEAANAKKDNEKLNKMLISLKAVGASSSSNDPADIVLSLQSKLDEQQKKVVELNTKLQTELNFKQELITELNKDKQILEELTRKRDIPTSSREVQTALKGENVQNLTSLIEDYKQKLDDEGERRAEREKYISELEQQKKQLEKENENRKGEIDALVKRYEEGDAGRKEEAKTAVSVPQLSKGEESEIISRLNSRISALQLQVHQLQNKVQEGEKALVESYKELEIERKKNITGIMAKAPEEKPAYTQSSMRPEVAPALSDHYAERMEAQEIIIVQLREEVIQLEISKRDEMEKLRLEIEAKDNKIKLLEKQFTGNAKQGTHVAASLMSSSNYTLTSLEMKAKCEELETKLKEKTMQVEKLTASNVDLENALSRMKLNSRLVDVLPSDSEMMLKLTKKIKSQKENIRLLQSLLRRAKIEFDRLTNEIQAKKQVQTAAEMLSSSRKDYKPYQPANSELRSEMIMLGAESEYTSRNPEELKSEMYTEWAKFEKLQYENKLQESKKLLDETKEKLNLSLRVLLDLKSEYTAKLMASEEKHLKHIHKMGEEIRIKYREKEIAESKVKAANERAVIAESQLEAAKEAHLKEITLYSERVKNLEEQQRVTERKLAESQEKLKKQEMSLNERTTQIQILMETVETLQKTNKDVLAQRYLNVVAELCSCKANNAKLESKVSEMATQLQELTSGNELLQKQIDKANESKMQDTATIVELKKLVELHSAELTKLEADSDANKSELSDKLVQLRTLEQEVKNRELRINQLKIQLNDLQNKALEQAIAINSAIPGANANRFKAAPSGINTSSLQASGVLNRSQVAASLNSSLRQNALEKPEMLSAKGEFAGNTSKQILVSLKQILIEVQKGTTGEMIPPSTAVVPPLGNTGSILKKSAAQAYPVVSTSWSPLHIFQQLCGIVLKSDKIIANLERSNSQLEQLLAEGNSKQIEASAYSVLLSQYHNALQENTLLQEQISQLLTQDESVAAKKILMLENDRALLNQSLLSSNAKLLVVSEENAMMKMRLRELQDKMEQKTRDQNIIQSKLQKEIAMASVKAEEEMSLKLSIRNEEIKTYFDSHVSKLILGREEGTQLLTLSREVVALKLANEKLQYSLESCMKQRDACDAQIIELMGVLKSSGNKLEEIEKMEYNKILKKGRDIEEYGKYLGNSSGQKCDKLVMKKATAIPYYKKTLKVELDMKNAELQELHITSVKLQQEFNKMAAEYEQIKLRNAQLEAHLKESNEKLMETNKANSELKAKYDVQNQELEKLEKRFSEMMSEHALEIQNIQSDMDLALMDEKQKLQTEYTDLKMKYKPGEAPGDILNENKKLQRNSESLQNNLDALESEVIVLKKKLELQLNENQSLKDEAEIYKKLLSDMQENIRQVSSVEQSKYNSKLSTPSHGDTRKKPSGLYEERKKGTQTGPASKHMSGSASAKDLTQERQEPSQEKQIMQMPRYAMALTQAKLSEADAIKKVRQCGRVELELRGVIAKKTQMLTAAEEQIRMLENILKDQGIDIEGQGIKEAKGPMESSTVSTLKKKIAELEACIEDMKLREAHSLSTYAGGNNAGKGVMEEGGVASSLTATEAMKSGASTEEILLNGMISLCNYIAILESNVPKPRSGEGSSGNILMLSSPQFSAEFSAPSGIPAGTATQNIVSSMAANNTLQPNASIEASQRVIIRSLTKEVQKLKQVDAQAQLQAFIPSNDQDKMLWYLELLEMQTKQVENVIAQLKDYTSKISVEISGSMLSAAQVKAAALELATQTKAVAEEANALRYACSLAKSDISGVIIPKSGSYSMMAGKPPIQGGTGSQAVEIAQLMDRLTLCEKVKRSLENELAQVKIAQSYDQAESKQMIESYRAECEKAGRKIKELEEKLTGVEISKEELRRECEKERDKCDQLLHELRAGGLKTAEDAAVIAKVQRENKELKHLNQSIDASRATIKDYELKAMQLTEEINKLTKENKELKLSSSAFEKQAAALQSEAMKALEKENKELESKLKTEIDDRKKEIEFWVKERAGMKQMLDNLKCEKQALLTTSKDKAKNEEVHSDSESNRRSETETKKKYHEKKKKLQKKYKEKIKALEQLELEKDTEIRELKAKIEAINAKKQLADLSLEEESKRKMAAFEIESKSMQGAIKEKEKKVVELQQKVSELLKEKELVKNDEIEVELLKENNKKLLEQLEEKAKKEEDLAKEVSNKLIELQAKDKEMQHKEESWNEEKSKLIEECNLAKKDLAENLNATKSCAVELEDLKSHLGGVQDEKQKMDKSNKELEQIVLTQEDALSKVRQEFSKRELEYKKQQDALKAEFEEEKASTQELISIYENQLKLLKERFKLEYIELNTRLTVFTQTKSGGNMASSISSSSSASLANKMVSPKKKEQAELNVDLMFQLSNKEATIKNLEKKIGQQKSKIAANKSTIEKMQEKIKKFQEEEEKREKKKKARSIGRSTKSEMPSQSCDKKSEAITGGAGKTMNESSIMASINLEDQLKLCNSLAKDKLECEMQIQKLQNVIKGFEVNLTTLKEEKTGSDQKYEEAMKKLEEMDAIGKTSKKELSETIKKLKMDLQKAADETKMVKEIWISPDTMKKIQKEREEQDAIIFKLKEEVSRKKDLLKSMKQKEELRESETGQLMSVVEAKKEDSENLKKLSKECVRKDQTIKQMKTAVDAAKDKEKELIEENKSLNEKIKALKAEISRKDTTLSVMKEKTNESRIDKEEAKNKEAEIEKLKQKNLALKQEVDRREEQIKILKAKVETLMNDIETYKAQMDNKTKNELSEIEKEQKKLERAKQDLKAAEVKAQELAVMLRTIMREILIEVEKLRSRTKAYKSGIAKPGAREKDIDKKYMKESMEILGLSTEEMGDFVHQQQQMKAAVPGEEQQENIDLVKLVEKINRVVSNSELPEDYNEIIEKYKNLLKEKTELEKFISGMEDTGKAEKENSGMMASGSGGSGQKEDSLKKYEKYMKKVKGDESSSKK